MKEKDDMVMFEKIRRRESGILLFGMTPPKKSTDPGKVNELAGRTVQRISSLPADGLILYDIQDEQSRNPETRPFPFMETIDPYEYADQYLGGIDLPKIIYRASGKYSPAEFSSWMKSVDNAKYASVFVGSPSSVSTRAMSLSEAYGIRNAERPDLLTGGVLIPERHAVKGDEHLRMFEKVRNGCSFFVTQCVYDTGSSKNLLSDYYYASLDGKTPMVPVIFTLTVCGSRQTLDFMKWLGIGVPRWLENDLVRSGDILSESIEICRNVAEELGSFCDGRGIPWGINVESVSVRKLEIEASLELTRDIGKILNR